MSSPWDNDGTPPKKRKRSVDNKESFSKPQASNGIKVFPINHKANAVVDFKHQLSPPVTDSPTVTNPTTTSSSSTVPSDLKQIRNQLKIINGKAREDTKRALSLVQTGNSERGLRLLDALEAQNEKVNFLHRKYTMAKQQEDKLEAAAAKISAVASSSSSSPGKRRKRSVRFSEDLDSRHYYQVRTPVNQSPPSPSSTLSIPSREEFLILRASRVFPVSPKTQDYGSYGDAT